MPAALERLLDGRPWLLPLALFMVAFFFRLHFMNDGLFHHDEVLLAKAVEGSLEQGTLLGSFHGRYGAVLLNLVFYAPYRWLTGQGAEKTIVLSAIVSGAVLVTVLYQLVRSWSGDRVTALLASLFLSFNLLFLTTSTIGKEQTHQMLFAVAGFWLVQRGAREASLPVKLLGMASFAYALTLHESTIVLAPVLIAILLLENASRPISAAGQARDLAMLMLFLAVPFVLYLGDVVGESLTRRDVTTIAFINPFSEVLPIAARDLLEAAGLPLAILAVAGLRAHWGAWRVMAPLLLWLATFFYFGNTNGYTARHLMTVVLPLCILAGSGAALLLKRIRWTSLRTATALLVVAVVCVHGVARAYPLINLRRSYCGPKEMAKFVQAKTEPNALVVSMDEFVFIDYYARRSWLNHPPDDYEANRKFVDELRAMADGGRPLYIQSTAFTLDGEGHFRRLLQDRFRLVPVGDVVDEDYHRPELSLMLFKNRLYRLVPRDRGVSAS